MQQGRSLRMLSKLYNEFGTKKEWLDIARFWCIICPHCLQFCRFFRLFISIKEYKMSIFRTIVGASLFDRLYFVQGISNKTHINISEVPKKLGKGGKYHRKKIGANVYINLHNGLYQYNKELI